MIEGLDFHHLGLAVRGPRRAEMFLRALGYQVGQTLRDDAQNVHLAMCTHASMPRVELVWPTETPGPLTRFLRAADELVYHMCFEVRSLTETVATLRSEGTLVNEVSPAQPAPLFDGRNVAFYAVAGVGLVELLEAANGEPDS